MEKVKRPQTITVEAAARLLGVSRSTAYESVTRREIPSLRLGRRVVIPVAALEKLLSGADARAAAE